MSNPNEIWGSRLKSAREAQGLSQKELGIRAGLDAFVASTRINRYELGVHKADYLISTQLALVLDVPVAYLYCNDDQLAQLILCYSKLGDETRLALLQQAQRLI